MSEAAKVVIYDTLQGKKVSLETLEPGICNVYCCGPTVYDMSHIGHARAAMMPDVLVRFLRGAGYQVTYVRNVTDVDDKIIARANEEGVAPEVISVRYTQEYQRDLEDLGLLPPDVEPRVTGHMEQIIDLVKTLEAKELAYAVDGDVYYRVRNFAGYGKLSKRNIDDLRSGARVEVDDRKESPLDFALWKAAKPGEPAWDSPWGSGRPGWHIECSAMSMEHLGERFDIHCGGRDLIFPHHENEIAQSQGACGESSFATYWMHNGFVNFAGEKMSKSLGNFFTIREVAALYHPEVLRAFLLGVHYRSPINFDVEVRCPGCAATLSQGAQDNPQCPACGEALSAEILKKRVRFPGLGEADERTAYVYETLRGVDEFLARAKPAGPGDVLGEISKARPAFEAAMADDLNTAAALATLSEPLAAANRLLASAKGVDKAVRARSLAQFREFTVHVAGILGLYSRDPVQWLQERRDLKAARVGLDVAKTQALVAQRQEARAQKDWETADQLRDALTSLGVTVRDGADGSWWTL